VIQHAEEEQKPASVFLHGFHEFLPWITILERNDRPNWLGLNRLFAPAAVQSRDNPWRFVFVEKRHG
jgi:hypothetical protein